MFYRHQWYYRLELLLEVARWSNVRRLDMAVTLLAQFVLQLVYQLCWKQCLVECACRSVQFQIIFIETEAFCCLDHHVVACGFVPVEFCLMEFIRFWSVAEVSLFGCILVVSPVCIVVQLVARDICSGVVYLVWCSLLLYLAHHSVLAGSGVGYMVVVGIEVERHL